MTIPILSSSNPISEPATPLQDSIQKKPVISCCSYNRIGKFFKEGYKKISFLGASIFGKKVAVEDRTKNPLYKALPSLTNTSQELLNLKPKNNEFTPVPFRESLAANWVPTEDNFFEDVGIQLAEAGFNAFCEKVAAKSASSTYSIPPIVHLIWMGSPLTQAVHEVAESWKKHNPGYEIKIWTDSDVKDFAWSDPHSKVFFESGKNWAEKSDILRFEILYQFGGVYSDTDALCMKSIDDLMKNDLTFFAGLESNKIKRFGRPLVGCSVMGAAKNSPVIKRCLDFSQTVEEAPTIHQHLRSGPGPTSKASYEALENGAKDVLILPCSYLYPMPWEKRLSSAQEVVENIRPETFAIHLWEGSWFDFYYPPKSP